MSERTLVTFSCGECGRDGFHVVDRNPPIPGEYVAIYDKDHEGGACEECPTCGTELPQFKLYHEIYYSRWLVPWVSIDASEHPHTLHEAARIMLACDDRRLRVGEVFGPTRERRTT